jgi:hypothetical protein
MASEELQDAGYSLASAEDVLPIAPLVCVISHTPEQLEVERNYKLAGQHSAFRDTTPATRVGAFPPCQQE